MKLLLLCACVTFWSCSCVKDSDASRVALSASAGAATPTARGRVAPPLDTPSGGAGPGTESGAVQDPSAQDAVLAITAPAQLREVESHLGPFWHWSGTEGAESLAALKEDPFYRSLVNVLEADLQDDQRRDPKLGVGLQHGHRAFDGAWLLSPQARAELVAVVNRLDRRTFRESGVCGETRLIYRLGYRTHVNGRALASRLPMTFNVVFLQTPDPGQSCKDVARRWTHATNATMELLKPKGPLSRQRLNLEHLQAVETNLQSVRWPSTVHPSLGGHAEYTLRVFRPEADKLVPAPLENTPNVERLKKSPQERARLKAWIARHVEALDQGLAEVPTEFLATRARSFSPHGLARPANRPYRALFQESDFADLPLAATAHIRSPAALLRRLDGMTCQGCHQTRSLAGFHVIGEPASVHKTVDAPAVATSPHFSGEIPRRREDLALLRLGTDRPPARPLSDYEPSPGRYGSHCGLGDPGFATWTCQPGLRCVHVGDPDMGACLPDPTLGGRIGDPCQTGLLRPGAAPEDDRMSLRDTGCQHGAYCFSSQGGFPTGMCAGLCRADERPGTLCGRIPVLSDFNGCLARNLPFDECIRDHADPATLRTCSEENPCRDDYICSRATPSTGVCIPPYFLFQLRVDGHAL